MSKEQKYLQKIENDVQERLYDLLTIHLIDVHAKVRKSGKNKDQLVALLERAIDQLRKSLTQYNKLQWYRYIIILCNKILLYQTDRQDIKRLKMELINDFVHSDEHQESIPLNNQVNELRITYDATYMTYLMKSYAKRKEWDKALYCLIVVSLIEPDNEDIDSCYRTISEHMKKEKLESVTFTKPKGMTLALDSNVVLARILYDVGEYRIAPQKTFDLERLGNENSFVITETVREEAKKHLEYREFAIRRHCRENRRFKPKEIIEALYKRLDKICSKYACRVEAPERLIKEIEGMYKKHLGALEEILQGKLQARFISHKLRKIAQREGMLPEKGDIKLLAEVITLNQGNEHGILTRDRDLTMFAREIYDRWGVKVFWRV